MADGPCDRDPAGTAVVPYRTVTQPTSIVDCGKNNSPLAPNLVSGVRRCRGEEPELRAAASRSGEVRTASGRASWRPRQDARPTIPVEGRRRPYAPCRSWSRLLAD